MSQTRVTQRTNRREFVSKLLAATPDALVVTGLGSPAYDVFAAGDRHKNYYLWGAMGGATSLGLGLALAQPAQSVVVITGDGEQLMGIGSLGTIAAKQPKNLTVVVLDNGHFGETGMQQSHSSLGTDLVAVSKGFGIADSFSVSSVEATAAVADRIKARSGTAFVQVFIEANEPPRSLPPRDGSFIKNRFRAALGLAPF
ncbi:MULTISPECIES: thiamine pyrophosphate-dependent enzyme [unclassified Acidovorax]|uniref:thiamine pyrophosphate-dependent enzyme n=1 Tax=unclassified Acidovorax TaxID=2684926 RepID=UPI001C475FE7|nr:MULTISPECIES: thiamine pyrophosphate-dependent enzyme [unclassified Acidovorax]MBV7431658.1 aldehyde dehydrogenase [Acidovorax sp. sif0732]MBV7452782.1 aldehyde dehydrogenase [Acidovorax sp. sif0715]